MPTYAGLATSDVVLTPAAQQSGVSESDLRNALSVRIEPDTTIQRVGVSGMFGPSDSVAIVNQVVNSLQSEIRSIETTPVDFQNLGSASEDTGTRIRSLSLTTSEPQIVIDANGVIPAATVTSTLTTFGGRASAASVASGLGTTKRGH